MPNRQLPHTIPLLINKPDVNLPEQQVKTYLKFIFLPYTNKSNFRIYQTIL